MVIHRVLKLLLNWSKTWVQHNNGYLLKKIPMAQRGLGKGGPLTCKDKGNGPSKPNSGKETSGAKPSKFANKPGPGSRPKEKGVTFKTPSSPKTKHRFYEGTGKNPVLVHEEDSDADEEEDLSWFYSQLKNEPTGWLPTGYGEPSKGTITAEKANPASPPQ